jgi:hypothetical protein
MNPGAGDLFPTRPEKAPNGPAATRRPEVPYQITHQGFRTPAENAPAGTNAPTRPPDEFLKKIRE